MMALLLLAAQVASGNPARIEQLPAAPSAPAVVRRLPGDPEKPSQAASMAQLPTNLAPVGDAREGDLISPPPSDLRGNQVAGEVARAIGVIRGRGQQVTPEVLAREVGPEVLEAYLALQNAPAPPAAPTSGGEDAKAPPPGTTIIPPGKL